jgi:4-hydroxybenzoate polyprenyltransferase
VTSADAGASARVAALLRSCHPVPTVAVTAVATALAVLARRDAPGVLLVAATVLAGQVSIGWLNDAVDAGRDRAAGRTDKPVAAGALARSTVAAAAMLAAVASVPLSFAAGGVGGGVLHALVVGGGWAYDLGLKSTAVSLVPYAVAFGALPAFVVAPVVTPPWWLVAAGALLGSAAHFANVLPDLEADSATGVRGLPHRLGASGSVVATVLLLLSASATLVLGPPGGVRPIGLVLGAVAVLALAVGVCGGARAVLFRMVMAVAVVDVLLLLVSGAAVR